MKYTKEQLLGSVTRSSTIHKSVLDQAVATSCAIESDNKDVEDFKKMFRNHPMILDNTLEAWWKNPEVLIVSERDFKQIQDTLKSPPPVSPRLRDAIARSKEVFHKT